MRRSPLALLLFLLTWSGLAVADPGTISLGAILSSAAGAAASAIVGNVFGKKPSAPQAAAAPAVEKPTVMPTPDDEAVRKAKARSLVAMTQRQGRASTILTGDNAEAMG